jgi:hypothetical protein
MMDLLDVITSAQPVRFIRRQRTPRREPSFPDFRVIAGSFAHSQFSAKMNCAAAVYVPANGRVSVDLSGSIGAARTAGIGACSSLLPIPAKVASPNRQRPFGLGGENWSSCAEMVYRGGPSIGDLHRDDHGQKHERRHQANRSSKL